MVLSCRFPDVPLEDLTSGPLGYVRVPTQPEEGSTDHKKEI